MSDFCFGTEAKIMESTEIILEKPTKKEIERLLMLKSVDFIYQMTEVLNILKGNILEKFDGARNRLIIQAEFEKVQETIDQIRLEHLGDINADQI